MPRRPNNPCFSQCFFCGLRTSKCPTTTPHGAPVPVILLSHTRCDFLWVSNMTERTEVWQGTLALMILKTLDTMGAMHGYGLARRIEQTSGQSLAVNYGTIYPALLKLEQEGYVSSSWGTSENNRRAKFYALTRAGRRQLEKETREWARTAEIIARFFSPRPSS